MSIDPAQRSYVSYIDKSREFYSASGYTNPYQWAYDPGTPAFTALRAPLSQLRVGLVTTTYPMPAPGERLLAKSPYAQPVDPKPDAMFTEDLFWDKNATHTRDTESFLPITRLQEQVAAGRIGSLNVTSELLTAFLDGRPPAPPPPPPKPLPVIRAEDIELKAWMAISPLTFVASKDTFQRVKESPHWKSANTEQG